MPNTADTFFINSYVNRLSTTGTGGERDGGTFSFYFTGNSIVEGPNLTLSVDSIEFPNALYNFPPYQSQLFFKRNITGDTITLSLNPYKIYNNIDEVVTDLNAQSTTYKLTFALVASTNCISATNSSTTESMTISNSYQYGNTAPNNAADRLGFTQQALTIPIGATLTAENPVRLLRSNCYFICCHEVKNSCTIPMSWKLPPVLAKITCGAYGILSQHTYSSSVRSQLTQRRLDKLSFEIRDENYELVSLPVNHPITMTIRITQT